MNHQERERGVGKMIDFALRATFVAFCVMGGYGLHDMVITLSKLAH
jgi:hypothetical protein